MSRFIIIVGAFFIFNIHSLSSQKIIERVEPPNWWVDMQHHVVEIVVYGQDIGYYSVSMEAYLGVNLTRVKQVDNTNYLFLTITIEKNMNPGNLIFNFSNDLGFTETLSYPLLARVGGKQNITGFQPSDMIYLITPDRYANGDTSNDNVNGYEDKVNRKKKGGRHGGDLQGIIDNLDYISQMGFTSIWLNPILENAMPKNSYHGYAITDFYKVDPRFGSNELYKELCEKAHEKGIKIIMDMVANHCGLNHWWMNDLPSEDWINQWSEYTETNHKKAVILDPYAADIDKNIFFDGWFVPSMPDLNQRNESLATYLIQNSIWWIEYAGISGIRMDTYPYPDMNFMNTWSKAIMKEYPNFNIVGEEWSLNPNMVAYWQKGKENYNGYTSNLKSLMDFPLQNSLVNSLNKSKTWASSWTSLYEMLGQDYLYPQPKNLVVFADNHDMSRIYTQLNEDFDLYKIALVYLATIRGIPQMYYGTEILMTNRGTDDHGIIRSDFPGGWKEDHMNAFVSKGLSRKQKEAQQFVKKLLNWRKKTKTIHNGKLKHFAPDNQQEIYILFRYNDTKKIMVVLSKNSKDILLNLSPYKEIIGEVLFGQEILTETLFKGVVNLPVKAKSAMIIELD